MFKKSKSDSKSYGIIGLGRFGSALAVELAKSGAEPLVIDGNEEKVREMREYTEKACVVNSFDKKTLDLCHKCRDELKALFNNSIHARLLVGAKAVEDLAEKVGDDRMLALCGCSGSHLSDPLRHIEEHMDK